MKFLKIFLVIVFCLLAFNFNVIGENNTLNKQNAYNCSFYSDHLNNHLFPEIRKELISYKKYLNTDETQELANKIDKIVWDYLIKNKLYVSKEIKTRVITLGNSQNIAFVLEIEINFIDKESSIPNLYNTVDITKRFIVFFGKKQHGIGA